ncbi:MAG: chromosomal replication initiator protein DnaA [SAR116 cluster bacterium]|nr:chromosomal replication initiator protein DnaA [SAR116 cluster bacterium]
MKFSKESKIKDLNIEIWDKVKNRLRKELGETLYRSWLKPLKLKKINKNTIILSAETSLVRDRVERQYTDRIVSIWASEKPGINDIKVSLDSDKKSENLSNLKDKNKNFIQSSYQSDKFTKDDDILLSNLDKRLTFENFVVGSPNELAFAAAKRVAEAEFVPFNPLFLYGGVGLGKTHLMNAIAWVIKKRDPSRKVVYISAEKFMYQFIKALRSKDVMNFKQEFRSVDVLMIDDVQFISGKEHTQEEFFHTFNALVDRGCQIVLSADKSPNDLSGMEERLKSRLGWGLVTDIQPTTYELRLGILQSRAEVSGIAFPKEVLEFIAQKIKSNVRELEGALNRIIAHTTLVGKKITLENTIDVLSDVLRANNKLVTIEDIQKKVAEHFSIKMSEMFSARRSKSVVIPRQIAMYLSKELTNLSYPEIGRNFGGKDHTTIIHASKKIDKLLNENSNISEDIRLLKSILSN